MVNLSPLLVLAMALCATSVRDPLDTSDMWAGFSGPAITLASYLPLEDLERLSQADKSFAQIPSFAESLKPRGLFQLAFAPENLPFCTALDLSEALVPDLFEGLTAQRFPNLVSVDLRGHVRQAAHGIPHPLPVLASVRTLLVSHGFLHFPLLAEIFPNLQSLTVTRSWRMPVVDCSFLSLFPSLKKINAVHCDVGALGAAGLPQSLTFLRIGNVEAPFTLPHLQELLVSGDWMLPDLTTLEASSRSLKKLAIFGTSENLVDMQSLRLMSGSLEEFKLYFALTNGILEQLKVIRLLTNLKSISLTARSNLTATPFNASKVFGSRLLALETLDLGKISAVINMQNFLSSVPMLKSLILHDIHLRDRPSLDVSHLGHLEDLNLGLTQLTDLRLWNETLNTGATRLSSLRAGSTEALHGLRHLRLLRFATFQGTAVLPEDVAQLINLRQLDWSGVPYVRPLSALVHLKELNIEYGPTPDLSPLAVIEKLEVITRETAMSALAIAEFLARFQPTSSG